MAAKQDAFIDWAEFVSKRTEFEPAEKVWRQALEPSLSSREAGRAAHIRSTITRTVIVGAVLALPILLLLTLMGGFEASFPFVFFLLFFAAIAAFAVNGFRWLRVFTMHIETKDLILKAATDLFGFEYDSLKPDLSGITDLKTLGEQIGSLVEAENSNRTAALQIGSKVYTLENLSTQHESAAFDRLIENGMLPTADKNAFEDKITGVRAGAEFELVECTITDTSGDSSTVEFQGILLDVVYPRPFLGKTIVSHTKRGWFDKLGKGLDKIDLNVPELDSAFTVYGNDQVEARYLLTPDRMQRLIELERVFNGQKLRALFLNGRMTIALEGENLFEGGSIFEPLPDPVRFQTALKEIAQVCDLIDGFLDHNWSATQD